MILTDDYKQYWSGNEDFFKLLKDNESIVFERLYDVIKVLDYIQMMDELGKKIDEEFEVFFDVGFNYLYDQTEELKLYFDNYFNGDYQLFKKYELLINYNLYLDDLEETLREKEQLEEKLETVITVISNEIEAILANNLEFSLDLLDDYNNRLMLVFADINIQTTSEVFALIVEELQL